MSGILRLGVTGLGRAFVLMLPTFIQHPRVLMVAAYDPRAAARDAFAAEFGGVSHASLEALCADPDVDALYIATPHQFHAEHVLLAAKHGKHVLVEKPMAIRLDECVAMIEAARNAVVHLLVGHSHSFDAPFVHTRRLIESGAYGGVRMMTALNFTDFIYRPRRAEELDTAQGGGVVFSQGAHQIDIARLIGGGRVASVRAQTGAWDPDRPTEGAYAALLKFADGAFATLTYNGYGHFDSDELTGWIGEMGYPKDPALYGATRAALKQGMSPAQEQALKYTRTYGHTGANPAAPAAHNHFGMFIASCERADLRPLPNGVMVYDDARAWLDPLAPPTIPRAEVIDELCDAIVGKRAPLHTGEWSMATLEVCLAILDSARSGQEVVLRHQVAVPAQA